MHHRRLAYGLIALLVLSQLWLLGGVAAATSCTSGTYVVGSESLNVRFGASSHARVMTTLPAGSSVQVLGEVHGAPVDGSRVWCKVRIDGRVGFIHSSGLTAQGTGDVEAVQPPQQQEGEAVAVPGAQIYSVNGSDAVNGYAHPNTHTQIVAVIPPDAGVNVIGQKMGMRVNGSNLWYIVSYGGLNMYVHSSMLSPMSAEWTGPEGDASSLTAPRGDGFYHVGVDIAPGHWTSDAGNDRCYWERVDADGNVIHSHLGESGGYVQIAPSDYSVGFLHCGNFTYVDDAPLALQADAYEPKGNGFYRVGQEIGAGNWRITGEGGHCHWARLDASQNVIEEHTCEAGTTIFVSPTDFELYVSDCGELVFEG